MVKMAEIHWGDCSGADYVKQYIFLSVKTGTFMNYLWHKTNIVHSSLSSISRPYALSLLAFLPGGPM